MTRFRRAVCATVRSIDAGPRKATVARGGARAGGVPGVDAVRSEGPAAAEADRGSGGGGGGPAPPPRAPPAAADAADRAARRQPVGPSGGADAPAELAAVRRHVL